MDGWSHHCDAHGAAITRGMWQPGLKWLGRTGDVVAAYGHLSGSGTMFGFFAPRPGAPCACARSR